MGRWAKIYNKNAALHYRDLESIITGLKVPSIMLSKKFIFKNLKKSPIGLTFKLVKSGFRCDYAMP